MTTTPSIPTNLFPFNGSAWTKLHFEADLTDLDSTSLTFYVDYSTNSTLSSGVTTLSSSVTASSIGTTVRGSITSANTVTENTVYYWRAYVKDESGNQSSYSPIFSFTIKNASGDNMVPDGTPFMQQGGTPGNDGIIVDINSANDTSINFTTMKNSGVYGCYVRCYGSDGYLDANFVSWVQQASVPTGGYYYAMPQSPTLSLTDAQNQAQTFANALQQAYGTGQYGDLIPILDLEDNSSHVTSGQATINMTVSDFLSWANEFRNHFESITGRKLGIYTDNYFVRNQMNNFNCDPTTGQPLSGTSGNPLIDAPLWIAGFDYYARYMGSVMPVCGGWTKWQAFQHTDKATATTYGVTASSATIDQSWSTPIENLMPPKPTTGVSQVNDGTNVTLTWTTTTEEDVHEWDIYVDGNKVGSSNIDGSYVITNAPTGTHTIEVRPIDDFGDKPILSPNTISYTINSSGGGNGSSENLPNVTINSINHLRLSDETGFTSTNIKFTFDKDVQKWSINVNGVDQTTGLISDSGGGKTVAELDTMTVGDLSSDTVYGILFIIANTQIISTIDWTELYQEGENRINIYGQNKDGLWTPYNQGFISILGSTTYGQIIYGKK